MDRKRDETLEDLTTTPEGHFRLHVVLAALRIAEHAGDDPVLRSEIERRPFLDGYCRLARDAFGEDVSADLLERELLLWEATSPADLPLRALSVGLGLSIPQRLALIGAGLCEEDARFGLLYAKLLGSSRTRPSLELLARLFGDPERCDAWSFLGPLFELELLHTRDTNVPRAEWSIEVPALVWNVVRGGLLRAAGGLERRGREELPALDALILPDALRARLGEVTKLLASGELELLILRGSAGADIDRIAGAIAKSLGRGLIALEGPPPRETLARLSVLATMLRAIPWVELDLAPGESVDLPRPLRAGVPLIVRLGEVGGLRGAGLDRAVTIRVPRPRFEQRRAVWRAELPDASDGTIAELAERFLLPSGYLARLASLTRVQARTMRRGPPVLEDARAASAMLQRQLLDTLAERVDVEGSWEHLVVGAGARGKLRELELRCRRRERILDHLGPAFGAQTVRGVRALFAGASGTGKTLAARILAAALGMELYRVDLSAVVNKYIGETEKNLHRVLSVAEDLDVVLLLDEGDSLLGGRTEVKSSNDRYANMETNFLLQRLESYDGILIVTTNVSDNIDRAFRRRMDVVVSFVAPGPDERREIWSRHLPDDHAVAPEYLERVAHRFSMTGGQIRNAAQHACLLALDEGAAVNDAHVEAALRSERQKAGDTWPLDPPRDDGGVEAFIGALVR